MEKQTVGIIGLGLLGTSLGIALRGRDDIRRIGWTRNTENLRRAVEDDVIDTPAETVEALVRESDIAILCVPVTEIVRLLPILAPLGRKGTILTDVGSAKGLIMRAAEETFKNVGGTFIGSHPMAGTEYSGYDAGISDLYVNAPVFVTPTQRATDEEVAKLCGFWRSIGAQTTIIDPAFHDRIVAHTSHISHLIATTLARTVLDCPEDEKFFWYDGSAGGFRDTTRIASSSPSMWRTIIEQNRTEVLHAMSHFEEKWHELKSMIESGNFDAFETAFAEGRDKRDAWLEYRYRNPPKEPQQ